MRHSLSLVIGLLLTLLCPQAFAAEAASPPPASRPMVEDGTLCDGSGSGYTEIDEEEDDDDDALPLNVMEERYENGRMAFLFGQYEIAHKAWLPLAETGYAKAQASLGWMYFTGKGVKKDPKIAAQWYRKAADQGHMIAQNNLGYAYEKGLNGPKDPAKAAIWYKMAAEQGYAYAQYNLGMLYAEGRGVKKDIEEAKYWLRIAARQDVEQATAALGRLNIALPAKKVEPPQPRIAHAPYHSKPVAKGIAWVRKQNPEHFTIQLARSKDMDWILRLAASGEVEQTLIHYQSVDRNGEEWHHLIYGSFPSRAEANAAIKQLPAPMQKWTPWVRPFSAVQKQLREHAPGTPASQP